MSFSIHFAFLIFILIHCVAESVSLVVNVTRRSHIDFFVGFSQSLTQQGKFGYVSSVCNIRFVSNMLFAEAVALVNSLLSQNVLDILMNTLDGSILAFSDIETSFGGLFSLY